MEEMIIQDQEIPVRVKYVKVVPISEAQAKNYKVVSLADLTRSRSELKTQEQPAVTLNIKQEPLDEEALIQCRACSKAFYNLVALSNHARISHSGADVEQWLAELQAEHGQNAQTSTFQSRPIKRERPTIDEQEVEKNRTALLSEMAPMTLNSLADQDVAYVIIDNEQDGATGHQQASPRRRRRKSDSEPRRRTRDPPQPITGPFECLEPSTLVAERACHQMFFSCCDYSAHYRDEHSRRRKGNKCQVCEKILGGTGEEPIAPYVCQVCGAGYNNMRLLNEHTSAAHVRLKPFQCGVCGKRFTQQGGLQQHMRRHTGDKPFSCSYCQKAFTQKSGLEQHLRIHTRQKPYRCVVCQKSFIQSVHLKQHMRTHTNVAPFQCVICEKRFKQSSHLNYHLKNHAERGMSAEQRRKYRELVGLIKEQVSDESIVAVEQVVINEGQLTIADADVATDGPTDGQTDVTTDEREYILSDNGDDTWTVKVVPIEG